MVNVVKIFLPDDPILGVFQPAGGLGPANEVEIVVDRARKTGC